jgi:hypothetical protein
MRHTIKLIGLAAGIIAATSCGNAARDSRSPVYLVVNQLGAAPGNKPSTFFGTLNSDVLTLVTSGGVCSLANPCPTIFGDPGQVVLSVSLKDIGNPTTPNSPTSNNAVTITRYHVEYRRSDGLKTPGVDVPFAFDGAATGTVPPSGTLTLTFTLVRTIAKEEAPLVQLVNNPAVLTTIADVTFYGTDQVGNQISVTASIQIDFGNFGDT